MPYCHFWHHGILIVIIKNESSNLKPCSKGGREDSLRFMDSIVILQVWNKGQAVPGYDPYIGTPHFWIVVNKLLVCLQ